MSSPVNHYIYLCFNTGLDTKVKDQNPGLAQIRLTPNYGSISSRSSTSALTISGDKWDATPNCLPTTFFHWMEYVLPKTKNWHHIVSG